MDIQALKNKYRIIGKNVELHFALEVAVQAAKTDLSVLINGESGVGKEIFSKIIHSNSKRKHSPFIAINCGALPEGTIDSELFGHEKGSFTGATDARKGYFETTNEGTVFLDEIGEMPLNTQARLLRILESGEYIRVGSSEVKKTNVRVVAATNKNLLHLIELGKFREDLYYRLSTIPIRVPALRDRQDDIFLLFRFFANEFAEKYKTEPVQLLDDAKQKILEYRFPGNIRELKNIVERLSVFSEHEKNINSTILTKMVDMQSQPNLPTIYQSPTLYKQDRTNEIDAKAGNEVMLQMFFDLKKEVAEMKKIMLQIMNQNNLSQLTWTEDSLNDLLETEKQNQFLVNTKANKEVNTLIEENLNLIEKEKEFIVKALNKNNGRKKDAAVDLGISKRTLFRRLKALDLNDSYTKKPKKINKKNQDLE